MKRVLITGAGRGIGKATAKIYMDNGYEVITPSRSEMNLADLESVREYVSKHKNDQIDIIINNAGINIINNIDMVEDSDIEKTINTNLVAPIYLLRGFTPCMKKNNFGRIVNIGSIWGAISKPGRSIYSATKHGIHGITTTLALELAPWNILVNTVAPGQTMTELTKKNNSLEDIEKMKKNIPVGRLAEPEDIAKAIFYFGSESNTYITGQQILVDGGLTIS